MLCHDFFKVMIISLSNLYNNSIRFALLLSVSYRSRNYVLSAKSVINSNLGSQSPKSTFLISLLCYVLDITILFSHSSQSDKEVLKEDLKNAETNLKAIENMLSTIEFHNEIID